MPLYFFHVHDGTAQPDPDGLELVSDAEAQTEALAAAGSMLLEFTVSTDPNTTGR